MTAHWPSQNVHAAARQEEAEQRRREAEEAVRCVTFIDRNATPE